MHEVTNELNVDGFSVNPVNVLIGRNNGNRSYNTMEFFCIYIVLKNSLFIIDGKNYTVKKGCLLFVGPSKDITFDTESGLSETMYVVAFSNSFYEKSVKDSLVLNSELFFDEDSEVMITQASIPIDEVYKLIITRLNLYKTKENRGLYISVAHNCVEALLLDGLFFVDQKIYKLKEVRKFTSFDVINRFRVLLQKHYKKEKHVAFYAELLHVTPRRLTEMAEDVLGKTAKQLIIDKMVNEGIRMLKHSNFTVSEVAYELGFNDEANFSTFIKKHTAKNPRMIRQVG